MRCRLHRLTKYLTRLLNQSTRLSLGVRKIINMFAARAEAFDEIGVFNFTPGASYRVHVTHVNNPGSFYVRSASLSDRVQSLETKGKPITYQDIKSRKNVIYNSPLLNKFVRGQIGTVTFNEENTTCDIQSIDYGCIERDIPMNEIFLTEAYDAQSCPPMAVHCELDFCHPLGNEFDQKATDTMKFFIGQYAAQMIVKCKIQDKLKVELRTVECPDNLSSMLAFTGCTQLVSKTYSVNRFDCPNIPVVPRYKPKSVRVGEKYYVRVQSGKILSDFYVADVHDFNEYRSKLSTFTEYCKYQPLQDVSMAANDGRCSAAWSIVTNKCERAIVKAVTVPQSKCIVKLIDWGTEKEMHFEHIKQVSSEIHTQPPAIAMHCSTEDQPWNNGLPYFLYPGYQFIIQIAEVGNEDVPHKVKIFRA